MWGFGRKNAQAKKKNAEKKAIRIEWSSRWIWSLVLLPLLGTGIYQFKQNTLLPINTIQLLGRFESIDPKEIESLLRPYVGAGFFSLDIQQVRALVSQKPWVESVSIRRKWPDRLMVTIVEKTPVARWDETHLISNQAQVFEAQTEIFRHLPQVHAVNSRPQAILYQYYAIASRFDALDEKVIGFNMDSRGAVEIELLDGLKIKLGREAIERKVERLVSIYARQIRPRREDIKQLDLRYSNGLAVGWKNEVLQTRDAASIWGNTNV